MLLKRAPSSRREVDMTPMIDCVFLLLIFFLVATDIKKNEDVAAVQLPQSAAALLDILPKTPPGPIVVTIMPKGKDEQGIGTRPYWVYEVRSGGNGAVTLEELKKYLNIQAEKQYAVSGKDATVRLRADRRSELQQLQWALKACQEAKILRVFIAAEKVETTT